MSDVVVWEATDKQGEFLACPDYEALYGGAAGGGKSDALLIDLWALQDGGPDHPQHRAIAFRRSYPELKDLIDRSHELFPKFIPKIKYDKNDHMWTTPKGAHFEFGYLGNDNDRFKYRGRAWNKIGFDELTLWPTPVCYDYMFSRNRTTARDLPCDMRSTTNPDGPGQKWVMERFGIQEQGAASRILVEMMFEEPDGKGGWHDVPRMVARSFIPAKLHENPFLRGTGYRERLMLMSPEDQDALLRGLWRGNRVEGAFYFKELQAARAQGRIGKVHFQPGIPVNTFWDLGINDANSIWFHQAVGLENRFIHTYQNSGEGFAHYTAYLQQLGMERGYVYGTHYLPHDGADRSRQTAKKDHEVLREMMPTQNWEIVPRVPHLITGIQQMRSAFPSCYFDEKECADGLAALSTYRKRYNAAVSTFTNEEVHDLSSNYAAAIRQFAQGFDGARVHLDAAEPEWKKKLRIANQRNAQRNPMTA